MILSLAAVILESLSISSNDNDKSGNHLLQLLVECPRLVRFELHFVLCTIPSANPAHATAAVLGMSRPSGTGFPSRIPSEAQKPNGKLTGKTWRSYSLLQAG
jgi:hypothetical protein